jgi:TolB protein
VWTAEADGSGASLLTRLGSDPAWSPQGSSIAFASTRDRNGRTCFQDCTTNSEIYSIDPDGGDELRMTRDAGDDLAPAWAPDGRHIVFVSTRLDRSEPRYALFTLDLAGGAERLVTNDGAWQQHPAWRPR